MHCILCIAFGSFHALLVQDLFAQHLARCQSPEVLVGELPHAGLLLPGDVLLAT